MNKNISIWRGNTAPPTSNHLWQKDGKLYHYDGTSWKENEVDLSTEENDGLMSKEDKHRLDNLVYNGLDSNDTDKALSAKQGKILSDRLEELNLSAYQIRGSVETLDDIPYDDLQSGYVYNILKPFYIDGKRYPEGTNVVWTGTKLDPLGGVVDFKDYSTTSQVQNMIAFQDAQQKAHQVSYTTDTFMKDNAIAGTFECKHLKITNAYIGSLKLYSITIKVASDKSLLNQDKTYLYVNNSQGTTVSLNSISQTINKGRYVTWFFDGSKVLDSGGQLTLSLHTTNVISEANDNNLVNFIICSQNSIPTDVYICNDDGSLNRNTTPELAINYVDISSIYPHMQDIKKHTMSYATSELSDLTTPSHRVNIKKIRINQSVMGISLINSVSIMVADDNAYDGQIHLNIYDTNSQQTVVSKNVVNLSDNLGKYVTWYFTPFKLTENVNYEFFADNEQLMRIHLSENKNEGVVCIDQYSYTREDFTPALGINIEPIVTDEIYSKAENIYADVLNNKSEINRIDNKVINFQYNVDEVRLNLSTTNAELDKTKQELTNTKQELSEIQAKIQDARAIADEGLSKADSAIDQIAEEKTERAAQDRALAEAVSQEHTERTSVDANLQAQITETRENTEEYLNQLKEKVDANTESINAETAARTAADAELQAKIQANKDLAQEGISKAESVSAMLFDEQAARKEADLSLNDLIEAEVTERLQSVATEAAERKAADAELRAIADEGLDKADSALAQIAEETRQRTAQDTVLAEAVSNERAERTAADADLEELISEEEAARDTAVNNERAARTAADAELQAKIQDHEDRIWKLENQWYGIEWDTEVSSPAVTRIGNMDLHRTLPIQSRMRGCLLDDNGKVTKYLNPKDWTGEVRDGSRGQVMVEIPMHYRRCETDGTKRRVKLSEYPLPDYHQVPRMYVSAYEASLQRSTKKLCSVVNTDPDFRGGNNQSAWDGTYRSLLGRPVTGIDRPNFRTYARNRNNAATAEWNIYTYHVHKAIYWLYVVEYANRNSQLPFTSELTAEGFRQGGLGEGVANWAFTDWSTFNNAYPFVPCGHTDILGNNTGVVAYTAYNEDGSELKTSYVPRYRGIENPFGHTNEWIDGINVRISPTEENGGDNLSKAFVCEDPYLYNDNNYNGYKYVGNEARTSGFMRDIIFGEEGEFITNRLGGNTSSFFCEYYATFFEKTETLAGVLLGGHAYNGLYCGIVYSEHIKPSSYKNYVGTRLCFLPSE